MALRGKRGIVGGICISDRQNIDRLQPFADFKYKSLILWHLVDTTLRFNEISKLIPAATPKMLTQQLRELEADKFIIRTVYPVVPPKVEYTLSDLGKSIVPVLDAMCSWGAAYLDGLGITTPN